MKGAIYNATNVKDAVYNDINMSGVIYKTANKKGAVYDSLSESVDDEHVDEHVYNCINED